MSKALKTYMHFRTILYCILFLGCIIESICDPTLNSPTNEFWRCSGCHGHQHEMHVYGLIRTALHREERNIYLTLDTKWMDDVIEVDSKVHVTVIDAMSLRNTIIPTLQNDGSEFQIVVTTFPGFFKSWESDHLIKYEQYLRALNEVVLFPGTDEFLRKNPCWIPVNEPMGKVPNIYFSKKGYTNNPTNNPNSHRKAQRRIMDLTAKFNNTAILDIFGNERSRQLSEDLSRKNTAVKRALIAKKNAEKYLILIKLPQQGFHATCNLFTAITKKQFPEPRDCKFDAKNMAVMELANIGLTHTINTMLNSFISTTMIKSNKIFITPTSEVFMARPIVVLDSQSNQNVTSMSGWAWAEPSLCPTETLLHDPWACNFISLSSCSDRYRSAGIPVETQTLWETPCIYLRGQQNEDVGLGITDRFREEYADSPKFSEEQWARSRLKAFVQRPNMWLRYLLRKSLLAIQPLDPVTAGTSDFNGGSSTGSSADFSNSGGSAIAPGTVGFNMVNSEIFDHSSKGPHGGGGGGGENLDYGADGPCIVLHVRHNDAQVEERRKYSAVDRSLESHVKHARNLSVSLGAKRIFLATDNATVVELAPTLYPEFTWYTQRRPMSSKAELFLMFTKPFESPNITTEDRKTTGLDVFVGLHPAKLVGGDSNAVPGAGASRISTGVAGSDSRLNKAAQLFIKEATQGGAQSDMAHVFADMRYPMNCAGIVGAFDSALTQEMYLVMCAMGAGGRGKCPPSVDLRKVACSQEPCN